MSNNEPLGILLRLVLAVTVIGLFWGTLGVAAKNFLDRLLDRRDQDLSQRHFKDRSVRGY
jgi:hypothetical protein